MRTSQHRPDRSADTLAAITDTFNGVLVTIGSVEDLMTELNQ